MADASNGLTVDKFCDDGIVLQNMVTVCKTLKKQMKVRAKKQELQNKEENIFMQH